MLPPKSSAMKSPFSVAMERVGIQGETKSGRGEERRKCQCSSGSFTEHQFTVTVCEVKIQQYCRKRQSSDFLERTLCDVGKEKLTCDTKKRVRAFQEYFIH